MKIAQVTSTFPPYMGGIGNVAYNISYHVAKRGHQVTVLTPLNTAADDQDAPFRVRRLRPWLTIGNASIVPSLFTALRDYDIIHLHYPFFGGDIFVVLAALWRRIPYVLTYHQDATAGSGLRRAVMWIYRLLFERFVFQHAAIVFGLSEDHLQNSRLKNVLKHPDRYRITGNGITVPQTTAVHSRPDIARWKPTGAFVVGFIGNLDRAHYFKNLPLLLHAMARLDSSTVLIVAGGGDQKSTYQRLAQELGVSTRVLFLGNVDNSRIYDVIEQLNCLVLPSTEVESFGIVVIEALACGKPVIVSDIPGVRTLVTESEAGIIVERNNLDQLVQAVQRLQKSPKVTHEMGERGRAFVQARFTWDIVTQKIIAGYESVLEQRKSVQTVHP